MIGFTAAGSIRCGLPLQTGAMDGTIYTVSPLAGSATDLAVMRSDGSSKMVLLSTADYTGEARWAPYDSRLSYACMDSSTGKKEIFVANPDGSGKTQITAHNETYGAGLPQFVKGRTKIWYWRGPVAGVGELWEMGLDGSGPTKLTDFQSQGKTIGNFALNANETKVVYSKCSPSWSPTCEIMYANSDFTGEVQLASNGVLDIVQDLSPDGQTILFFRSEAANGYGPPHNLYRINVDGTGELKLTSATGAGQCDSSAWSPDGSRIVASCFDGTQRDIFITNADGSDLANITNTADLNESVSDWQ